MSPPLPLPVRTAETLRRRIVSGSLASGERLPTETKLMAELGVGRSTLREAVRILEREGLVRVRQGSGTYVDRPDRSGLLAAALGLAESAHIVEVRRVMEPTIARIAAGRRTPDQAREILRLAEVRRRCGEADDLAGQVEADVAFHRALATATNNPVLSDLFDAFARVLARLIAAEIQSCESELSARSHERLAQAVAIGDPDDAEAAALAILNETGPA